ncbi:MAG: DNA translocase FtsK [Lactobacillaceae bacterium]|jgi:S-DNA-T family DNA segregation ATPase FtsK/SpoIIIE|nr:DNA translocase FtsK [Lactobacillaceae bacterium]
MAGRPRKTPVRRKTTPNRKRKQNNEYKYILIGSIALLELIIVLAVGKFGLVGKFFANLTRWLVGGTFQVLLIFLGLLTLYLVTVGIKKSALKVRHYIGLGILYLGVLLAGSIMVFNAMGLHHEFVGTIQRLINQDMINQAVTTPVGGGVLGAFMLSGTYLAASNIGSWIVAIFLILTGIIVLFKLNVKAILTSVFGTAEVAGTVLSDHAKQAVDTSAQKVTELKSSYQKNRANLGKEIFDKDFEVSKADTTVEPKLDPNMSIEDALHQAPQDAYVAPTIIGPDAPTQAEQIDLDIPGTEPETLSHVDLFKEKEPETSKPDVGATVEPTGITPPEEGMDINGFATTINDKNYKLPTTRLLTRIGSTDQSAEKSKLAEKSRVLTQTLKSFNIDAPVEKVILGPTITQYELRPAIGVKVSKITNLADDLALALAAKSLRIEAPIPGKSLVGIEVANNQQAMVGFRDMMDQAGVSTDKVLEVPIGKSVTGEIVKMNITKMPHLLIAGSTGSGKSVAINSILASILLQAKPSEVRLMLVDPKKVELSVYNDIPHLITPVVSNPRKAAAALKKVVMEMDNRFKTLSEYGVRNIDGYNLLVKKTNDAGTGTAMTKMPYLVVVIDELADLMMTVSGEVEPAIVRIAQLGRAAGIHMIVATQRPSVDVITGLIKANVPSRMAFAVGSGVDSRTILDGNGAEKLLGRGDMLFAPIGVNSPMRVQGAFLSDEDVESLTDFIKKQGGAQYDTSMEVTDDDIAQMSDDATEGSSEGDVDEMWDAAIDFVNLEGKGSASMLQRHFRMGYNRAARLADDLVTAGILGPADSGNKGRPVLMTKEQYYAMKNASQQ